MAFSIRNKKKYIRRTCSTSSALVAINTRARVTVHMVTAGAAILTWVADTFIGI